MGMLRGGVWRCYMTHELYIYIYNVYVYIPYTYTYRIYLYTPIVMLF